jgi:excisionase family DNA binding protein
MLSDVTGTNGILTVEEAAARFGIHRTTLFRWIKEGRLPVEKGKLGDRRTYVQRAEVEELVGPSTTSVSRCLELVYQRFTTTGEWPVAMRIQRELDKTSGNFDFVAALESLPRELGWCVRDQEGRAQLTLQGIARCENSTADINAFLAFVRTCYEQYLSNDANLKVTGAQVATTFGFDALMIKKLYQLLQIEAVFWTSMSGGADGSLEVALNGDRIRHFRNVESLDDYVAAKQRALQPAPGVFIPSTIGGLSKHPAHMALHPVIAQAVGDLLDGQSSTAAVMAAATAFERLLKNGLNDDKRFGHRLVNAYFDRAQRAASPDPRRAEALRSLALGAVSAFRNPAAHGQEFAGAHAREIVSLFSLLAREMEVLPMPFTEVHSFVLFDEADVATRLAFAAAGHRHDVLASAKIEDLPGDWYCEAHLNFVDRNDVGLTYGKGIEPMPICTTTGCPGRGWVQVHPIENVPSPVVGGRGQMPVRATTRLPNRSSKR